VELGRLPCRGDSIGKVGECESCLAGIHIIGETFPEVCFVNEHNPKLGGYHLVHDSASVLGGSLLGDVRRSGDREVNTALDFVYVGPVGTPGYEADWGDLVSFLDDEERSDSVGDDGLMYLRGQGGEPTCDWLETVEM
jgi:hypothetical protein